MTLSEKLAALKSLLKITDTTQDTELSASLDFAKRELISWRYGGCNKPPIARTVDSENHYVALSVTTFISAVLPTSGSYYIFTYSEDEESWQYESSNIELLDYGIQISSIITPIDEETITIKYIETPLAEYDTTIIMACVIGYGISGAEGQTSHSENSISRAFKYEDMLAYIRGHVAIYAGVI